MASRVLHLVVLEELMKDINVKDKNRFRLGCMMPDLYNPAVEKADSHLKVFTCGKSKKTYDLEGYLSMFGDKMDDDLYKGYYLHLIQDLIFRELVYNKYKWNPLIPGNVNRLHNDYRLVNAYVIKKYGVKNDIQLISDLEKEKLYSIYPFKTDEFLKDMERDFSEKVEGDIFFFTKEMADEFVKIATENCHKELHALNEGKHYVDAYERAWLNKPFSLLKTTQNTRELGGYRTKGGTLTKNEILLRSDVQNYPSEDDYNFLKMRGITTIIDMRGAKDVARKPSGFAEKESFKYYNFHIDEGSGVPESMAAVPNSYMDIAAAKAMPEVFKCIANSKTGVMFNCSAGKDRTGVVTSILLLHVGVSDKDIIDNYVITKEYGRERLELVHKNFPEIDMNIVTPCEMFMEEFLSLFREKYGDTEKYFKSIGLSDKEIQMLQSKLL
jgi:protein tyrosine/serine phosphatase